MSGKRGGCHKNQGKGCTWLFTSHLCLGPELPYWDGGCEGAVVPGPEDGRGARGIPGAGALLL